MIGQHLGRYRVIGQLGAGGMAVVYKAHDPQLDREVAIKVIKQDAFAPDQMERILMRFDREAKILAGLNHPNIVKILDFGEQGDMPYLVMEYIAGHTLKKMLMDRRGVPVPWREAARMLAPIARALDAAHKHQGRIIHRDVKPSNILIDQYGIPMLTDFGIARSLESRGASRLTTTGGGVGTRAYMAPEQWSGQDADHRVDIYALGCVFFEMVTGRLPYLADTELALMAKKINEPPPSPSRLVPGLPDVVEFILLKSLANRPQDRYTDMGELAGILDGLARGILPEIIMQPVRQPGVASRSLPYMVASGIVLLLLVTVLALTMGRPGPASLPDVPTETTMPVEPSIPATHTEFTPPPIETSLPTPGNVPPVTRDQAELVFVPEGEFLMGSNPSEPYFWGAEAPKHTVYLDTFWIYITEVTNSMYRACVEDDKCPVPQENHSHTIENYFNNPDYDGYPVIYVTHADAATYCEWAGGRLPTEAEWEKAARGTDGYLFPWGDGELQDYYANFCDEGCPGHSVESTERGFDDGYRDVAPVGSYPDGASPFGVLDMAGNVLEWVADWYAVDYYIRSPDANPMGPEDGTKNIIRGGSWWSLREGLRPAARASKSIDYSSDMVGFRCAVDAP